MARFCPAYPTPRRNKASGLLMFLSARHSWLDALYERSYRMQMGEVRLPGLDLYMVNEPGLVRRVMVEQAEDFPKSELLGQALEPLLGESIFTTSGEQWRRQRAMMDPAFAQARLQVAFPVMAAATEAMLARLAARWREEGFAFAGAFLREGGGLAGMVGLMRVRPDMPFAPAVEIGWRIAAAHQRRGLAEEAARAWLAHNFGALGLREIVAFTVPANEASWRLMEKLGMRRAGAFDHPALPEGHTLRRHLLYRLARPF